MNYKIKMSSTIPVVQYGNIIPTIEVEGENYEELEQEVMNRLKDIWNRYCPTPLKEFGNDLSEFEERKTFTGETIMYDKTNHIYLDMKGNRLLSGSLYAKQFEKPFDKASILPKFAKKHEVSEELVDKMWEDNSELSRFYGNAIHKLLENWFRYGKTTCYTPPKNVILAKCLEAFPLKDAEVIPEVLISDVSSGMVGQIDGLVKLEDDKIKIIDYKSDANIEKNLDKHFNQLSFYATILKKFGFKIDTIEVWNYTDEWKCYTSEVLEIKK